MGVALITPFKEDGSVDYDALLRLVDYQLQNNTDFLCVLGTTAETPTLSDEEKKQVKKDADALRKVLFKTKPANLTEGDMLNIRDAMNVLQSTAGHILSMAGDAS